MAMRTYLHRDSKNGPIVKSRRDHIPPGMVAVVPEDLAHESVEVLQVEDYKTDDGSIEKRVTLDKQKKEKLEEEKLQKELEEEKQREKLHQSIGEDQKWLASFDASTLSTDKIREALTRITNILLKIDEQQRGKHRDGSG